MLTSPGKSERKRLWAGHLLLFLFCIHPTSFSIHLSPLKGAIGALLLLCVQLLKLDGCFFVYSIPFHSILFCISANAQPMYYYTRYYYHYDSHYWECGKNHLIHILREKEKRSRWKGESKSKAQNNKSQQISSLGHTNKLRCYKRKKNRTRGGWRIHRDTGGITKQSAGRLYL
jgi:hypothetical protein